MATHTKFDTEVGYAAQKKKILGIILISVYVCCRGVRGCGGAGAARRGERRARTMLASFKGFWKACRYGDLYMVRIKLNVQV